MIVKDLPVVAPKKRTLHVYVDAGHGGDDPGARGLYGTIEKDITLEASRMLCKELETRGIKATISRKSDYFIPIPKRVEKADELGVDLVVSMHVNAVPVSTKEGFEIHLLEKASYALPTANKKYIGAVTDEDKRLHRLLEQRITTNIDLAFKMGKSIIDKTSAEMKGRYPFVVGGLKSGLLRQLACNTPKIPINIVELEYCSSPNGAKKVKDKGWLATAARGIALGVESFAKQYLKE